MIAWRMALGVVFGGGVGDESEKLGEAIIPYES